MVRFIQTWDLGRIGRCGDVSFGRRLRLFVIGIVAIPMIVLAVLVVSISRDSRDGKADARLSSGLDTAQALYDEALEEAPDEARAIGADIGPQLAAANGPALKAAAHTAVADSGVVAVTITASGGKELASAGPADAIAFGESNVGDAAGGGALGTVRVAMLDPDDYLDRVSGLTGKEGAIVDDTGSVAATDGAGDPEDLQVGEEATDVELANGDDGRAAGLALAGAGPGAQIVLLTPVEPGFVASEPLVAVALALFFAVAFLFIVLLLRDLQRRIATMLEAARRIGEGDFESRVPVEGDDEMAGLAREMNRMSDRLSEQMRQLRLQRKELNDSVRRIGEAFASGLDREALLAIVAETAVSACGADAGRAGLRDQGRTIVTRETPGELAPLLRDAGTQVWQGEGEGVATEGELHAIAEAMSGSRAGDDILCAISVARRGEPFSGEERETLRFLIGRTIASAENIDEHERAAEQAVTDGLTGIPNHRAFLQWLERESARVHRYGGELSLVLLDIDDFKLVNDTRGHLQGDRVLERIGSLLAEQLRGVDLAARYGGEEFVLALPDTPREGALLAAERLRRAVSQAEVEGIDGTPPVSVTASLGVATMPGDAADGHALIAAADEALYEAKRAGKNCVVGAEEPAPATPQGNGPERRS